MVYHNIIGNIFTEAITNAMYAASTVRRWFQYGNTFPYHNERIELDKMKWNGTLFSETLCMFHREIFRIQQCDFESLELRFSSANLRYSSLNTQSQKCSHQQKNMNLWINNWILVLYKISLSSHNKHKKHTKTDNLQALSKMWYFTDFDWV